MPNRVIARLIALPLVLVFGVAYFAGWSVGESPTELLDKAAEAEAVTPALAYVADVATVLGVVPLLLHIEGGVQLHGPSAGDEWRRQERRTPHGNVPVAFVDTRAGRQYDYRTGTSRRASRPAQRGETLLSASYLRRCFHGRPTGTGGALDGERGHLVAGRITRECGVRVLGRFGATLSEEDVPSGLVVLATALISPETGRLLAATVVFLPGPAPEDATRPLATITYRVVSFDDARFPSP